MKIWNLNNQEEMKDQYEQVMNATEILKDNSFIKLDDKDPEITHPSAG